MLIFMNKTNILNNKSSNNNYSFFSIFNIN